ncbi:ABC transporter substrate-binding protein [Bacillota bacterium]
MVRRRAGKAGNLKNAVLAVLLALNMFWLPACAESVSVASSDLPDEDIVRIGIYQPLSGEDKEGAKAEIMGIELAHKLQPRVLGKNIELVYADNKSDVMGGKIAALKMVNKKVSIVLGSYGNIMSMTGGAYFQEAGIPAIAITCSNPLVTKGNPYYFRVSTIDSFQAVMAAKYVYNELKVQNAAIMKLSEDDYGSALAQQFSDKLNSLAQTEGEEAVKVTTVEYDKSSNDYSKQFGEIVASGAEVIYLPCPAKEAVDIIAQAREHGVKALFMGTDLWREAGFIEAGGKAVEGVVFTDYFDAETATSEKAEAFLAAYHKEYGEEEPESATALGFDAYMLALNAIEEYGKLQTGGQQNPEGETLRALLAGTREYQGVTGSITFDTEGDPIKSVVLTTVDGGEFKHKYTAEPEWNQN